MGSSITNTVDTPKIAQRDVKAEVEEQLRIFSITKESRLNTHEVIEIGFQAFKWVVNIKVGSNLELKEKIQNIESLQQKVMQISDKTRILESILSKEDLIFLNGLDAILKKAEGELSRHLKDARNIQSTQSKESIPIAQ